MFDPDLGIACVVGTRPEVVKTAPILAALREYPRLRLRLIATGQHRDLLDLALADFGLTADLDLGLMRPDQSPAEVAARGLEALSGAFRDDPPALVLAQGDTTTVLCAALAAFYARIPFGHVEAGLRTFNADRPFPEETQRVLTSRLARFHFVPTAGARDNLLREGIDPVEIHLTGNTVIDALRMFAPPSRSKSDADRVILVTAHRRENQGEALDRICDAVEILLGSRSDIRFLWPLHPNPRVGEVVRGRLGAHERVDLTPAMGYRDFLRAISTSCLVMTDSGGVQEEAPSFGKPVVVLRDETERGEFVAGGAARLVGTDTRRIVEAVESILCSNPETIRSTISPVGDGWAAERVARILLPRFGIRPGPKPVEFPDEWNGST